MLGIDVETRLISERRVSTGVGMGTWDTYMIQYTTVPHPYPDSAVDLNSYDWSTKILSSNRTK